MNEKHNIHESGRAILLAFILANNGGSLQTSQAETSIELILV
jgi:hypothetical protein